MLAALICSPYVIKTNGMSVIPRLKKASKLFPQEIPSLAYMEGPASGSKAPRMLRQQLAAAAALAEYSRYASVM